MFKRRRTSLKKFRQAKSNMLDMRMVVNGMLNSDDWNEYTDELKKLDENLRFCDDSVVDEMDQEIEAKIKDLASCLVIEGFDVHKAFSDINNLINQRNFAVKNKKSLKR